MSDTHSSPSPQAVHAGEEPTFVVRTRSVAGSIREIVPSDWLVTHTAPAAGATPVGCSPTLIVLVRFVPASIRVTVLSE